MNVITSLQAHAAAFSSAPGFCHPIRAATAVQIFVRFSSGRARSRRAFAVSSCLAAGFGRLMCRAHHRVVRTRRVAALISLMANTRAKTSAREKGALIFTTQFIAALLVKKQHLSDPFESDFVSSCKRS